MRKFAIAWRICAIMLCMNALPSSDATIRSDDRNPAHVVDDPSRPVALRSMRLLDALIAARIDLCAAINLAGTNGSELRECLARAADTIDGEVRDIRRSVGLPNAENQSAAAGGG